MEWTSSFYAKAKQHLLSEMPDYWPGFEKIAHSYIEEEDFPIEIMLMFSACKAVDGVPENAIEISAGLMYLMINFKILKEIESGKNDGTLHSNLGIERALNYASAFRAMGYQLLKKANCSAKIHKEVSQIFYESSMISMAGQDRHLLKADKTWVDYWRTSEMRTCFLPSATAGIGAIIGTNRQDLIQACQTFGYHWGLAQNIVTEILEFWGEAGNCEDGHSKITLPILYGIYCEHPEREILLRIIRNNRVSEQQEQIRAILDHIDAFSFLKLKAIEEKEKALQSIEICPNKEGKDALHYYLNSIFEDVDNLFDFHTPKSFPSAGNESADYITLNYKSVGLKLRQLIQ